MGYKQAEILKGYIEQLQAEAFEEGVKVTTKALSKQMSALEKGQILHGHWIHDSRSLWSDVKCSECGELFFMKKSNYCPNCGAKMDEEVKDEQG